MNYPHINPHINKEELNEHFNLTQEERFLLPQWRKSKNILGFAIVLKAFEYLGYLPREKEDIPSVVTSWIGEQLDLAPILFNRYQWKDTVWDKQIATIRNFTGFRPINEDDSNDITNWLIKEGHNFPSRQKMFISSIHRCRELLIELPMEKELQRLVNSTWQKWFDSTCKSIVQKLPKATKEKMELCINTPTFQEGSYEWLKSPPGRFGMSSIRREIKKRLLIDQFGLEIGEQFQTIPGNIVKILRDRAFPEGAYQVKRHPEHIRYALLAALLYHRRMEVTDNIVNIFLHLIRVIDKKADHSMEQKLIKNIQTVYGKRKILYTMAKAALDDPQGSVQNVLFPVVGQDVLHKLIEEFEGQELDYENSRTEEKKIKYQYYYRQMMKPVLNCLTFRSNNPLHQPLLNGIALVCKYIDKKNVYYPETEDVPDELIEGNMKDMIIEEDAGLVRVVKHYFELSVLQQLEKALKCKEIWVEAAFKYRDPDQDLPQDWKENRQAYYSKHNIPEQSEDFINPIKEELIEALDKTNEYFSQKQDVYIYHPGNGEAGLFRIPKITGSPDRPILQDIKKKTIDRWGVLDLADVLLEADRQVDFSRYFYSTAQRHVLSPHEIRERLLLSILGRGTGMGLKRIYTAAKPSFSYDDLLYFNRRFVHIDSLRDAIAALFNRILEVRDPDIWKATTECTSDAKHLSAWEQNLVTDWNPHYKSYGIMSYWHVDKNSAGIYSQVRGTSEVAAMIAGLILHNTMMKIGSNYVDTGGQSELAFAICRFLTVELLPWLRRMKYERLHLPDAISKDRYPHLAGVLDRPIRWGQIDTNYDDMVRHVVAAKERTAPIDSILRRFNRNNPANPTYKGFIEAGKAIKTIHDCRFLIDPAYRQKIHGGRNVIESWNSVTDFLNFGGKTEIASNDPEIQEITILCLHLLQNSLVLVNTFMIDSVLHENDLLSRMKDEDLNALTPLFTSNVNPYGDIHLNFNKPSIFEAIA